MEQPNHMRKALARLEARRLELEREITEEIDRKFFTDDGDYIDLTATIYNDPPLSSNEQMAWDAIIARF